MQILEKKKDKVFVFKNFLSKKLCNFYSNKIKDIGDIGFSLPFEDRTWEFTDNQKITKNGKKI